MKIKIDHGIRVNKEVVKKFEAYFAPKVEKEYVDHGINNTTLLFSIIKELVEYNWQFFPLSIKMCYSVEVDVDKKIIYIDTPFFKGDKITPDIAALISAIGVYVFEAISLIALGYTKASDSVSIFVGIDPSTGNIVSAKVPLIFAAIERFCDADVNQNFHPYTELQRKWAEKLNTYPAYQFISSSSRELDVVDHYQINDSVNEFRIFLLLIEKSITDDEMFCKSCFNALAEVVTSHWNKFFLDLDNE